MRKIARGNFRFCFFILVVVLASFSFLLFSPSAEAGDTKLGIVASDQHNVIGNLSISDALTVTQIARVIVVDGIRYTQNGTGINAAIADLRPEGGTVFLPEGNYSINVAIDMNLDNMTLQGAGRGTILNAAALPVNSIEATSQTGLVIKDLRITGGTNNGILWNDVDNGRIEGVWIESVGNGGGDDGIELTNDSDNNVIANNYITGNTGGGILIAAGCNNTRILGNHVTGNTGIAIEDNSSDSVMLNNGLGDELFIQSRSGLDINLSPGGASNYVQLLTGNLRVGQGTPSPNFSNGVDAYIEGNVEIGGDLSLGGDTTIAGVIFGDGFTQITGDLTATGDLDVRGKIFDGAGPDVDIADNLSVDGDLTVLGALSVDGGTLFVDASRDFVGIGGPLSPVSVLHIVGIDSPSVLIQETTETAGDTASLFFKSATNVQDLFKKAAIIFESDGTSDGRGNLFFAVDGTADNSNADLDDVAIAIQADGDVGINTRFPVSDFDVLGDASISGSLSVFNNLSVGEHISATGSEGRLLLSTPAGAATLRFEPQATWTEIDANANLFIQGNGVTRINVSGGGADVFGNFSVRESAGSGGSATIENDLSVNRTLTVGGIIRLGNTEGASVVFNVIDDDSTVSNSPGGIMDAAHDLFVEGDIEVGGDVSIAESLTARSLFIGGAPIEADNIHDFDNNTIVHTETSPNEDFIRFTIAGTERMTLADSGRFGIGTLSPSALLDVRGGDISVSGSLTVGGTLRAGFNDNTPYPFHIIDADGAIQASSFMGDENDLYIAGDVEIGGRVSMGGDISIAGVVFSDDATQIIGNLTTGGDLDLRGKLFDGAGTDIDIADRLSVSDDIDVNDNDILDLDRIGADDLESTQPFLDFQNTNTDIHAFTSALSVSGDLTVDGNTLAVDASRDRVGINTNDPDAQLHVVESGTASILVQETNEGLGDTASLEFKSAGNTDDLFKKAGVLFEGDGSGSGRGDLHLALNNANDNTNVSVSDAVVTILREGNVGIGTTEPRERLGVVGDVSVSGQLTVGSTLRVGSTTGNVAFNAIDNDGVINSSSFMDASNDLYVEGDVEIGGRISISGDTTIGGVIFGDDGTQIIGNLTASDDIDLRGNLFDGAGEFVDIADSLSVERSVSIAGNLSVGDTLFVDVVNDLIGIGTATPGSAVHVYTSVNDFSTIRVQNAIDDANNLASFVATVGDGALTQNELTFGVTGDNYTAVPGLDDSAFLASSANTANGLSLLTQHPNAPMRFIVGGFSSSLEHMRIQPDGDIGIGTTNPQAELDVLGDVSVSGDLSVGDVIRIGNTQSAPVAFNVIDDDSTVSNTPGGIMDSGSDLFVEEDIEVGGDVSIANSLTAAALFVNGVGVDASNIHDDDNDTIVHTETTNNENRIRFTTANVERMIIDEVGHIGVGTSTPVSDFGVVGNVSLSGSLSAGGTFWFGDTQGSTQTFNVISSIPTITQSSFISTSSDLYVEGDVEINGQLSIGGDTTIAGVIFGDDGTQIIGNLTASDDIDLRGNIFDGAGEFVDVADSLSVSRNVSIAGNLSVGNLLQASGGNTTHSPRGALGIGRSDPESFVHIFHEEPGSVPDAIVTIQTDNINSVNAQAKIRLAETTSSGAINNNWLVGMDAPNQHFTLEFGTDTTNEAELFRFWNTGDMSITGSLTVGDVIRVGAGNVVSYNAIDNDTNVQGSAIMDSDHDLYVEGDVEVGQAVSLTGALTAGGLLRVGSTAGAVAFHAIDDDGTVDSNWSLMNDAEDLFVEGDVEIGGDVSFGGNITIAGVIFSDDFTQIEDELTVTGDLDIRGSVLDGAGTQVEFIDNIDLESNDLLAVDRISGGDTDTTRPVMDFQTAEGDLAIEAAGLTLSGSLTLDGPIRIGSTAAAAATGVVFNVIDDDGVVSNNNVNGIMDARNDLFVEGDIEVGQDVSIAQSLTVLNLFVGSGGSVDSFRIKDADEDTIVTTEGTGSGDDDIIRFQTDGVQRGVVSNNGNFGIGTLSPSALLDVRGTLGVSISGNLTVNDGTLYVDAISSEVGIGNASPDALLDVAGNVSIDGNVSIEDVFFVDVANNRIGINTATSSSTIHVEQTPSATTEAVMAFTSGTNFVGHASGQYLGMNSDAGFAGNFLSLAENGTPRFEFRDNGVFVVNPNAFGGSTSSSFFVGSGLVQLLNGQTVTQASNRFSIQPTGVNNSTGSMNLMNVDIVDGTSGSGGWNALRVNHTVGGTGTRPKRFLNFRVDGTPQFVVDGQGNLGIGADLSPTAELEVLGDVSVSGDLSVDSVLRVGHTGGAPLAFHAIDADTTVLNSPLLDDQNDLYVAGDQEIGMSLSVNRDITLGGSLFTSGGSTLDDLVVRGVIFDDQGSEVDFQDGLSVSGDVTINGVIRIGSTEATFYPFNAIGGAGNIRASSFIGDENDLYIAGDVEIGGRLSMASDVTIGGVIFGDDGTQIIGNLTASDDLDLRGKLFDGAAIEVDVADNLSISGSLTIYGNDAAQDDYFLVDVQNDIPTIFGAGAYVRIGDQGTASDVATEDDLLVTGSQEIDGNLYVDTIGLDVGNRLTIDSAVSISGHLSLGNNLSVAGDLDGTFRGTPILSEYIQDDDVGTIDLAPVLTFSASDRVALNAATNVNAGLVLPQGTAVPANPTIQGGALEGFLFWETDIDTLRAWDGATWRSLVQVAEGRDIDIHGSTIHLEPIIDFVSIINLTDDNGLFWNGTESSITYEVTPADPDHLSIGLGDGAGDSRALIISEASDRSTNWGHAISADPIVFIQSSDETSTNDYISLHHNQTNAQVDVGSGMLGINSDTSINGNLSVQGNLTVSGTLDLDGDLTVSGAIGSESFTRSPVYYDSTGTEFFLDLDNTGQSLNLAGDASIAGRLSVDNSFFVNGNVGVGVTTLSERLEVDGRVLVRGSSAGIVLNPRDGTGTAYQWFNPTGDDLRLNNGADVLAVTNAGDIGIGTTNPQADLDVIGDVSVSGDLSVGDVIRLGNTESAPVAFNAIDDDANINASSFMDTANDLYVEGDIELLGRNASFGGDLTINGTLFGQDALQIDGDLTITGALASETFTRSPVYYDDIGTDFFLDLANTDVAANLAGDVSVAGVLSVADTLRVGSTQGPVAFSAIDNDNTIDSTWNLMNDSEDLFVEGELEVGGDVSVGGNITIAGVTFAEGGINLSGDIDLDNNDLLDVDRIAATDDEGVAPFIDLQTTNTDVDINASALSVTGYLTVGEALRVGSLAGGAGAFNIFDADSAINATSTYMDDAGDLYLGGDFEVGGRNTSVAGDLTIGGTLFSQTALQINGDLTITGALGATQFINSPVYYDAPTAPDRTTYFLDLNNTAQSLNLAGNASIAGNLSVGDFVNVNDGSNEIVLSTGATSLEIGSNSIINSVGANLVLRVNNAPRIEVSGVDTRIRTFPFRSEVEAFFNRSVTVGENLSVGGIFRVGSTENDTQFVGFNAIDNDATIDSNWPLMDASNDLFVEGDLEIGGNVSFGGDLTIAGVTFAQGGINLNGDLDLDNNDVLDVDRIAATDDEGVTPFIDLQTTNTDIDINTSALSVSGTLTLQGPIRIGTTLGGAAVFNAIDSDATIGPVSSTLMNAANDLWVEGDIESQGELSIGGNVTVSGSLFRVGGIDITGDLDMNNGDILEVDRISSGRPSDTRPWFDFQSTNDDLQLGASALSLSGSLTLGEALRVGTTLGGNAVFNVFDDDTTIDASSFMDEVNDVYVEGDLEVLGRNTSLGGDLTIGGQIFSNAGLQIQGDVTATGAIGAGAFMRAPIYYDDDASGTEFFLDLANTGPSLNLAGNASIAGDLSIHGEMTLGGDFSVRSVGQTPFFIDASTNQTRVASANELAIPFEVTRDYVSNDDTLEDITYFTSTFNGAGGSGGLGPRVVFRAETATNGTIGVAGKIGAILTDATAGSEDGALIFEVANAGDSGAEKMRIDNNGDVGIGTITPSGRLGVRGDVSVSGDLSVDQVIRIGSTASAPVAFNAIDNDATIDSNWALMNDAEDLFVEGDMEIGGNVSFGGDLTIAGVTFAQGGINLTGDIDLDNNDLLDVDRIAATDDEGAAPFIDLQTTNTDIDINTSALSVSGTLTLQGPIRIGTTAGGGVAFNAIDNDTTIGPIASFIDEVNDLYIEGDTEIQGRLSIGGDLTASGALFRVGGIDITGDLDMNNGDILEVDRITGGNLEGNPALLDFQNTTNEIQFFGAALSLSGNLSVDTDTFFVDGTNDRVGINVNNPDSELHVVGGTVSEILIQNTTENATNGAILYFKSANNFDDAFKKSAIIFENQGVGFGRGDMHFVMDDQANSDDATTTGAVMTIQRSGEVGIGTRDPDSTLGVIGDASVSSILSVGNVIRVGSTTGDSIAFSAIDNDTTIDSTWNLMNDAEDLFVEGELEIGGDVSVGGNITIEGVTFTNGGINLSGDIDMQDNDILDIDRIGEGDTEGVEPYIDFNTQNNELAIMATGVGIGTANPDTALDVLGNASISGNLSIGSNLSIGGSFFLPGIIRASDGTAAAPAYSFTADTNTGIFRESTDILAFATGGAERLSIDAGGTLSTSGNMSIAGNLSVGGQLFIEDLDVRGIIFDGTGPEVDVSDGLSVAGALTTFGNVNVNTGGYQHEGVIVLTTTGNITLVGRGAGAAIHGDGILTTAVGSNALQNLTNSDFNTAVGSSALQDNTQGTQNTAVGALALSNNTFGNESTAFGYNALQAQTTGDENTAVGSGALVNVSTGSDNTAIGRNAGGAMIGAASRNILIGSSAAAPSNTGSDQLNIGGTIYGDLANDFIAIGGSEIPTDHLVVNGNVSVTGALTVAEVIRIGHPLGSVVYNAIDDDSTISAESSLMDAQNDLFVEGDVEIGGSLTIDDSLTANAIFLSDGTNLSTMAGGWDDDGAIVRLSTATDSVGIGTASPDVKLDVLGNVSISGNLSVGNDFSVGDTLFVDNASGGLGRVLLNNKLAIGDSFSPHELYVEQTATQDDIVAQFTDGADTINIYPNALAGFNNPTIQTNTGILFDGTGTLSNAQLALLSSGNIGMGVISSDTRLGVAGDISISGSLTSAKAFRIGDTSSAAVFYNVIDDDSTVSSESTLMDAVNDLFVEGDVEIGGSVTIDDSLTAADLWLADGTQITGSGEWTDGGMVLYPSEIADSVGIGTQSPSATLGVIGDVSITGDLSVDGVTLYVDSASDSVGIGILTPSEALQVVGQIMLGEVTPWNSGADIQIMRGTTAGTHMQFGSTSNDLLVGTDSVRSAIKSTLGDFEMRTGGVYTNHPTADGTVRMVVKLGGNIGIGTTNPSAELGVSGDVSISGDLSVGDVIRLGNTQSAPEAFNVIDDDNIVSAESSLMDAADDLFVEGDIEVGGSVTIDNSLTVADIWLASGTQITGSGEWTDDGNTLSTLDSGRNVSIAGNLTIGGNLSAGRVLFARASDARVGVNIQVPVTTLHVRSNVFDTTAFFEHIAMNSNIMIEHPSADVVGFEVGAGDSFTIAHNGTESFRIDASRNVGIGTTSPGATLGVAGDLSITGDLSIGDVIRIGSTASAPEAFNVIDDDATVQTSWPKLDAANDLFVEGDLATQGDLSIAGDLTVLSDVSVFGNLTVGAIFLANGTSLSGEADLVRDDDNDTLVQVNEGDLDNDTIRFDTDGVERTIITSVGDLSHNLNLTVGGRIRVGHTDGGGAFNIFDNDATVDSNWSEMDGADDLFIESDVEIGNQVSVGGSLTVTGGLNAGGGALSHDLSSGVTSIESLEMGSLFFETNGGIVSWVDMPVTSAAADGTEMSYVAQMDSNSILQIQAFSDGAGGITDQKVTIFVDTTVSGDLSVNESLTASAIFLHDGTQVTGGGAIGSSVEGGTAGSVLFIDGSGNLDQDNTNFFFDDTAKELGLGTNAPAALLDVNGNVTVQGNLEIDTHVKTDGNTTLGDAAGDEVTFNADVLTFANDTDVVISGGTDGLTFDTSTMSIDATNDRVGFGTTAPNATVDINGGLSISGGLSVEDTFTVKTNGFVGIGTSQPTQLLNIGGRGLTIGAPPFNNEAYLGDIDRTSDSNVRFGMIGFEDTPYNFFAGLLFIQPSGNAETFDRLGEITMHTGSATDDGAMKFAVARDGLLHTMVEIDEMGDLTLSRGLTVGGHIFGEANVSISGNISTSGTLFATGGAHFQGTVFFDEYDNVSSVNIDWRRSNKQRIDLDGNLTLVFDFDPDGPCNLVLVFHHDGTATPHTVTWPGNVNWPGGTEPTFTASANAIDIVTCYYDGTNYYCNESLNFAP